MTLVIVGAMFGVLAFLLGWWTNVYLFWDKHAPMNNPPIWRKPHYKLAAMALTAFFSIVFAGCFGVIVSGTHGIVVGWITFGGLLVVRAFVSAVFALSRCMPALRRMQLNQDMAYWSNLKESREADARRRSEEIFGAIKSHSLEQVNEILRDHPEVVSYTDESGRTPLYLVAAQGEATKADHVAIAERLLDAGADPNAKTRLGWTPIHAIAMNGSVDSLELAKLLLKRGADIHATANDGITNWRIFWQHGKEIHDLFLAEEQALSKGAS
jgi:hypothetical protein